MKLINSAPRYKPVGPYSQAVLVGDLLFSSGIIGIDAEGNLPGGLEKQVVEIFETMKSILAQQGLDFHHIVKTTVHLANMDDYLAFNNLYTQVFTSHLPARSAVQVAKLPKGALVEIEFIASNK